MFYSTHFFSKNAALGKVWQAAHMDKKLNKVDIFNTKIDESIGMDNFLSSF